MTKRHFTFYILHFTFLMAFGASACMTFIAGKKVSTTGHVIVGHNEDDWPPFTVHHGMLPARDWPAGTMLPATKGCCARIPQVPHTLACYWGEVKFETGDLNADTFLNEKGVIVVSDSGGSSTESMGDQTLLTEDGQWRIKGYTHTVDKYSLRQASTVQGVGFMWKKEF